MTATRKTRPRMQEARRLLALARHPRAFIDNVLTYSRFIGTIKPSLLQHGESEFTARLESLRSSWWPSQLHCPLGRRILAISPHPDDETIGAGGLLLAHRGLAEISVITVFSGNDGGVLEGTEPRSAAYGKQLAAARLDELRRACRHFSARIIGNLELADGSVPAPIGPAAARLRELVDLARPEIVVLPWFLDNEADHRTTNLLWAIGCAEVPCIVLGSQIWSLSFANAYFDITDVLPGKILAIKEFTTQLATVDYVSLAEGLAKINAFRGSVRDRRAGAAESFFAFPNREYCDIVCTYFRERIDRAV